MHSLIDCLWHFTYKFLFVCCCRDQQYEYVYSDDEEEEEENQEGYSCVDSTEKADITCGSETLYKELQPQRNHSYSQEFITPQESLFEDSEENHCSESVSVHNSPQVSDFEEDFPARGADSLPNYVQVESRTTSPINLNLYKGISHHCLLIYHSISNVICYQEKLQEMLVLK